MSGQIDGLFKTFRFASAVSGFVRVGVSNGADYGLTADNTGRAVGVLQEDVAASGYGTVKLFNQTYLASITGSPATRGDVLYRAVTGQYSTTGTVTAGILLENVAANGVIAEVYPINLI